MNQAMDLTCINTIRTLSMDGVQAANSGHPGTPMSMAPVAYTLWQEFLRFDPEHAQWFNRDRFVLSIGHASMLLYSLLHLANVRDADGKQPSISLDDIRGFRQLESRCAGHPEYELAPGIEMTTGPLGQGVATSIGMAMAGRWLAARFNRPDLQLFDYDVYALCGDGDMMEGISSEAASLAGHLKLSNLCWIYDQNQITIEGRTNLTFSEDVSARFSAYGWDVEEVSDANDLKALSGAFSRFREGTGRPLLIVVNSRIGFGAPNKEDTSSAHGEPLGEEEIRATKRGYGWPEDATFLVPEGVREHFQNHLGKRGRELFSAWQTTFARYQAAYPDLAEELKTMENRQLPAGWDQDFPVFPPDPKGMAGRVASGKVLNTLAQNIPWLFGGSADLSPSTKTRLTFEGAGDFQNGSYLGRNFHFGIREHAMGAILNGLSLCKVRPFGSGFLIFSDYARPAIRLSALMELPTIHVFTHDSIGVGEDGPTHQPVEQLASLRAVPGLIVLRPADANEVVEAWRMILELRSEPVALILSRQNLPTLDRNRYRPASDLKKGGYVLADSEKGEPEVLLLATGSSVSLAVEAFERLSTEGVRARVVSLPSWELFEQQSAAYRDQVLPPAVTARVAIEEGVTMGWEKYVGSKGKILGMNSFGASAPANDLMKKFGFTVDHLITAVREQLIDVK